MFSPKRESAQLPLQTKRSIVSEASDFLQYYENEQNSFRPYQKEVEESLDDFIVYLKGLKNKFLEDLVLNKIAMVTDGQKQEKLIENYPKPQSQYQSKYSSPVSNRVFVEDSNYESLKEFEKEVDKVISDEEKSITVLKEDESIPKMSTSNIEPLNETNLASPKDISEFEPSLKSKPTTKFKERQSTFKTVESLDPVPEPMPEAPKLQPLNLAPIVEVPEESKRQPKVRPPPLEVNKKEEKKMLQKPTIKSESAASFSPYIKTPSLKPKSVKTKEPQRKATGPSKEPVQNIPTLTFPSKLVLRSYKVISTFRC